MGLKRALLKGEGNVYGALNFQNPSVRSAMNVSEGGSSEVGACSESYIKGI